MDGMDGIMYPKVNIKVFDKSIQEWGREYLNICGKRIKTLDIIRRGFGFQ
jgi:hypothetical protein